MSSFVLKRTNRKNIAAELDSNGEIVLKIPRTMTDSQLNSFLNQNGKWLTDTLNRLEAAKKEREEKLKEKGALKRLTSQELEALASQAMRVLPKRAEFYAKKIGVTYGGITIRNQKTRWGSCSAKGNLNFNCLLMLAPAKVQDYVVVHELCHRIELNHSARFWALVEKAMPDYKEQDLWLKEHGGELMARMLG